MANILVDGLKYNHKLPGCLDRLIMHNDHVSILNKSGNNSTLSVTLYRAFRFFALMIEGKTTNVGLAVTKDKSHIAEIHHDDGSTDICILKPTGTVYAAHHDGTVMERYIIGRQQRGGSVLYLALMEEILSENEAKAAFNAIKTDLLRDPLTSEFQEYSPDFAGNFSILCDNVYSRMFRKGTPNDITIGSIPNNGTLRQVTSMMLESDTMKSQKSYGKFHVYKDSSKGKTTKKGNYTPETFAKAFTFNPQRVLSKEEENMVPVINKEWIIPEEAERICKHILKTTSFNEPSRTFLLEGLAGTGKTSISSMVASGVNLPKVVYTCHTGTEMIDIIGTVMPKNGKETSFYEILKENNYPSIEDIQFDLEGSYERLEGKPLPLGMDEAGCISLLIEKVMKHSKSQGFEFVESDFIKALKYGWVCEIQEPTAILQQGVLVGLNSLLEPNGVITLPTGECIRRHPDTIIIFTTNPSSYKGCDTINQSVLSRVDLKIRVEATDKEMMAKKAMAVTGFTNQVMAMEMADIVDRVARYLKENDLDDGVCGQRELKGWMQAVMVEGEERVFEMALDTIISKATEDENEKEAIINGFLRTSSFA